MGDQTFAGGRQRIAVGQPVKQLGVHVAFQALDPASHGGL